MKTAQELRLSYNEFTHIVGSHPKQVAQVSQEVQSTQRGKICQSLSRYISLLVESNTIIRKLKKDISSNLELDYHELQELLDPTKSDAISFDALRHFMDDCGRSLQRGDFEEIKQHIAPTTISDRMKFKDFVSYLSDKTITSVVVHNRSNCGSSRSPSSVSPSRDNIYIDSSFQSSSSSFYKSGAAAAKNGTTTVYQQSSPMYDSKYSTKFYDDSRKTHSPDFKRFHTHSTVIDSISPKHLSTSQSSLSFTSSSASKHPNYLHHHQNRHQQHENPQPLNRTSTTALNATATSTSGFRNSRLNGFHTQQAVSPTKNKDYEPSLFKDPKKSILVSNDQLNATAESLKRIRTASKTPKKGNERSFDSRYSTYQQQQQQYLSQSKDTYSVQSPTRSRYGTEVSRIEEIQNELNVEKVKNAASNIVGFLQILKEVGQFEESIEENKKRLTRATKFSPSSIFRYFDNEGKGYLRYENFAKILVSFDVKLSEQDQKLLFNSIEKNHDGFISEQEFSDIFCPEDIDYEDLFNHKPLVSSTLLRNPTAIEEAKYAKQLFVSIVEREKRLRKSLDQLRRNREFDRFLLFSTLDENNDGFVTSIELADTLRAYNILLKQSTHRLVFNLLDRTRSGQIKYADFLDFITQ